jgi:hypothetical protein
MRSYRVVPGQGGLAQQYVNLRHDAKGGGNLLVHQQLGAIALATNPTNSQTLTLTINGTGVVITFVSAIGTTAGNVLIGASAAATLANLLALLNQPQTTTSIGVALSTVDQQLLSYLSWPLSSTTVTPCSNNNSLYAPLTSFSASTTVTSGSWTAQTMQLYVEPGVVYVNGTRVIFSGGSTPTVSGPVSNPRIDVLTVDNTGTLAWTTGTENSSPSAPTYPADKVALCELYNVVSETALYDSEDQQSGQGYISNDVRPFIGQQANFASFTDSIIPASTSYNLGSSGSPWGSGYFSTNVFVSGSAIASAKFGGSGTDGALSITSGTTTLSASSAPTLVKNYTSISITSSGVLAFSNPNANGTIIILKSQGGVTLTSSATPMINASAMGAAGGAAVTADVSTAGNVGSPGKSVFIGTNYGGAATTSAGGTGGAIPTALSIPTAFIADFFKYSLAYVGAGGGSGSITNADSSHNATSGAGGIGGGCLIIECGGALDFTTTNGISVAGQNGGTATDSTGGGATTIAGGGGGGAGGLCVLLYNALTANSGTITVSGGTGGNTGSLSNGQTRYGGAGGASLSAGNNGSAVTTTGTQVGGNGAAGISLVAANNQFS